MSINLYINSYGWKISNHVTFYTLMYNVMYIVYSGCQMQNCIYNIILEYIENFAFQDRVYNMANNI